VEIVKKCANVEEASRKLVETALALGTMDNTTVIVIKLDWCIDFITQDEIEGRVDSSKVAEKKPKEEIKPTPPTEKVVPSFRNSLESFNTDREQLPKGIYPQVSSSGIKLKVLIPSLEATKLMKFDSNTNIQDIKKAILQKHRFADPPECFQVYHKVEDGAEDQLMEEMRTVAECKLKDMDVVEMRRIGSPSRRPSTVEGNPFAFSEALPGANESQEMISQEPPTVKDSAKRSHRITAMWSATNGEENPDQDEQPSSKVVVVTSAVWKKAVIPDSPRRPRNKPDTSTLQYDDEEEHDEEEKQEEEESTPKKKKKSKSEKKKHKKKSESTDSDKEAGIDKQKESKEEEDHNDESESVE